MSLIRDNLKYTQDHEWLDADGEIATIGITDFAQESLGDVTFVELPKEGTHIGKGSVFGVVESVKAASDLYSPVSGTVTGINKDLESNPALINSEPYDGGWVMKLRMDEPSQATELLSPVAYRGMI